MNRRMVLAGPPAMTGPADFDPRLAAVLEGGFEEVNRCVVLAQFVESARRTSVSDCGDETGFEAFVNHVHVEELLPDVTRDQALAQAVAYVSRLGYELGQAYPSDGFVAVIAVSDSCTTRFHKSRPAQEWLAADIEGYDEAVMRVAFPAPAFA